jgi:hypothetical protein
MAGKKKLTPEKIAFYRGIIAALAVVHITDNPVLYHEIIDTVDESELIRVAVANEDMEWSGLAANGYRKGKLRKDGNAYAALGMLAAYHMPASDGEGGEG